MAVGFLKRGSLGTRRPTNFLQSIHKEKAPLATCLSTTGPRMVQTAVEGPVAGPSRAAIARGVRRQAPAAPEVAIAGDGSGPSQPKPAAVRIKCRIARSSSVNRPPGPAQPNRDAGVLRHGPGPDHRPAGGAEAHRAALWTHAARPAGLPGGAEDLPPREGRAKGHTGRARQESLKHRSPHERSDIGGRGPV